uniref:Fanconi-associated nuclease n=1 Tax=Spumella elongata TaxID=89044 RepID=A0A7S3HLV0_9STRA
MNGEGEEEDDLLLLGLLPDITPHKTHSTVKDEYQLSVNGSFNSRPSLEDLIPAPPFFVVTGKRTGDPASRKGKSKFCGLNDELVNVETYVMQKCHIIDTDDCPEEINVQMIVNVGIDNISEDCVKVELLPIEVKEEATDNIPTSARKGRSSHKKTQPISDPVSTMATNNATQSSKSATSTADKDKKDARRVPYPLAIDNGGWQGWHCEGSIFKTLFGLLMWDVLFACPICNNNSGSCSTSTNHSNSPAASNASGYCVFVTPFQDAPLDLGHRSFYRTRRVAIQKRIAQIASFSTPQLIAELGVVYRKHYGENCRGVHWGVTLPLLQLMAVCMGSATVAAVCNALSVNYKHFTGGAPDLMLVRVQRRIVRTDTVTSDEVESVNMSCYTSNVTDYAIVPVQQILGQDWETQLNQPVVLPRRSTYSNDKARGSNYGGVQTDNDAAEGYADEMMEIDEEHAEESNGKVDDEIMDADSNNMTVDSPVTKVVNGHVGNSEDSSRGGSVEEPNVHFRNLFLPHLAPTPDIVNTDTSSIPSNTSSYTYEYKLEARFIEVKGPTDSLMFRQRVWLHILNSAVAKDGNIGALNYNAYVCHVKEE